MIQPYQLVLDIWAGNPNPDVATLKANKIAGMIVRLNSMSGGHRMDTQFTANWQAAQQFDVQAVYFVYRPGNSGRENYEWMAAHLPADYGKRRVFVDIEVGYDQVTPRAYADQVGIFRSMAQADGRPLTIYTGAGFLQLVDPWPADSDYWWAAYPSLLDNCESWEAYRRILDVLSMSAFTKFSPGPVRMWQCSGDKVDNMPGFDGHAVDVSAFPGTLDDLRAWFGVSDTGEETESMWANNALIAAFDPIGKNAAVETIDFAALKTAGVHAVLLRCGGSLDKLFYDDPIQGGVQSTKYATWFKAATAAGLRVLTDFDFCPVLDSVHGYSGAITYRWLDYLLSGNLKPQQGGGLIFTCERNTWTEDTGAKTCTSVNYGNDLEAVVGGMFARYGLAGGVRSGRWFFDKTDEGGTQIRAQLGFIDRMTAAGNCPLFMAYPVISGVLAAGDLHDAIANVGDPQTTFIKLPNSSQVQLQAYYLYYGNSTKWHGWELAWLKHQAVKDAAGQPALFRLILWDGDAAAFDGYFNFPAGTETPGGDPGTEDPGTGEVDLTAVITRLDAQQTLLEEIKAKLEAVFK